MDKNITRLGGADQGDEQTTDPAKEALEATLAALMLGDNEAAWRAIREANQAMIALSEAEILDYEQRIEGLKEIIRRCQVANSARH